MARNIALTWSPPLASFPLAVSANGRYFETSRGAFFPIKGLAAWEIFNELSASDVEWLLAACVRLGVNTLVVQAVNPIKYVASSVAPAARGASMALPFLKNVSGGTWDGDPGFTHFDADFSTPNDPYWAWIVYVAKRARAYGIALIIDFIYWGYGHGAADGLYQTIANAANTQSVMFAFGQYLAPQFKDLGNLIVSLGTDTFPDGEVAARIAKFHDGLAAGGMSCPTLAHYKRSSGSLDGPFSSYVNVRGAYPGISSAGSFATNVARLRREWDASPAMPAFCIEDGYEADIGGGIRTRTELRTLGWHGILSTPAGHGGYGHGTIWTFDTGWQAAFNSPGLIDRSRLFAFIDSQPGWKNLQPHGLGSIGTLVTANGGTLQTMGNATPTSDGNATPDNTDGQDWVAAAATSDGSLLVGYRPDTHSGNPTLAASKMGGTFREYWLDPTNGVTTTPTTGIAASGTRTPVVPGTNNAGAHDWVLVWQSP